MSTRWARRQRGRPVWQALAVLMLLPLVAASVTGAVTVLAANRSADQALRAQRLVGAIGLLDTACRAADIEALPTMLLGVLQDEDRGQKFYGGQATIEVFGPAAKNLPVVYDAPLNVAITSSYYTELSNIEGGKDPARAWADAVTAGRQVAESGS